MCVMTATWVILERETASLCWVPNVLTAVGVKSRDEMRRPTRRVGGRRANRGKEEGTGRERRVERRKRGVGKKIRIGGRAKKDRRIKDLGITERRDAREV